MKMFAGIIPLLMVWNATPTFAAEDVAKPSTPSPPVVSYATDSSAPEQRSGAVVLSRIDTNFVQSDASCTLASYAIAANYFTGRPVSDYFKGYCSHFRIFYSSALDAERKYSVHFDGEFRRRNCSGCEVILDLHSNSMEQCFVEARRSFDARFYHKPSEHIAELEQILKTRDALLNVGYPVMDDAHSVTVLYDGSRFLIRNTGMKGFYPVSGLAGMNQLLDAALYVRKPDSSGAAAP